MTTLYNLQGLPVAYQNDNGSVYSFSGRPLAFVTQDNLHLYNGKYIGWIENGWIYDRSGRPILFSRQASGGPVTPVTRVDPVKSVAQIEPVRGVVQVAPVRPVAQLHWSGLSYQAFFDL